MDYWSWHTNKSLLEPEEVMIHSQTGASLYDGEKKTQWKKGKIMLSTHRLLYREITATTAATNSAQGSTTLQLSLADLTRSGERPSTTAGFAFSSDKVILPLPGGQYTRVSFRSGGMKEFFEELVKALAAKAWMREAPSTTTTATSPSAAAARDTQRSTTTSVIGIAGVMRQSEEKGQMQEAFQDIDDVMAKASALVSNIRQLKERAAASDRTGAGTSTAEERTAIESIEETLGLGTMVTTTSSTTAGSGHGIIGISSSSSSSAASKGGKKFHLELATELHAWMTHPRSDKLFGEMPFVPLIELFSVYNRARSGELVSPDDLLQACKAMARQGYSVYTLEEFSSGRMALAHKDDSIVLAKLIALMGPMLAPSDPRFKAVCRIPAHGVKTLQTTSVLPRTAVQLRSVNEVQLANSLRVAIPVAKDVLDNLTLQGYLCSCDAGYGCSVYYWNVFAL